MASKSNKGGAFERKIAKSLSLWWTGGKRDDIFWRTAGSGGRATVRRKVNKTTAGQEGDIAAIDPIGQPLVDMVAIELKKGYNEWTIKELIDSNQKDPMLLQFFNQCEREKKHKGCRGWWLITGQDRRKELVFFDRGFRRVLLEGGINPRATGYIAIVLRETPISYCMTLEDFLKMIDPQIIKAAK